MAADSQEDIEEAAADARMQIQDIIESLRNELTLTEPGNPILDRKIAELDKIFDKYVNDDQTVHVSQARMDMVAFSKLASINHQRIRRVAASSWTFRATDFANRIIRLMNVHEGSQSESLSETAMIKLDKMLQPCFNQCVPLKPLLGAISLTKVEAVPKERRQRQPRTDQRTVVPQQVQPKKMDEIAEEDKNTKVTKHVEYIMRCLVKLFNMNNENPVPFYHFVLDPTSYSNSVENIFFVSFLIKDGFVSVTEDGGNGYPSLNVVKRKNTSSQQLDSKQQFIMSLNMGRWQELCKELGIKRAAIDPKAKSNSPNKRPRHQ